MYQTPYQTAPLKGLNMNKVTNALSIAKAEGNLRNEVLESAPGLYVVVGKSAVTETIPPFGQPVSISDPAGTYTVIDMRSYNSKIIKGTEVVDPDGGQAEMVVRSALLQTIWEKHGSGVISGLGTLPMQVFSTWISNVLSRVLGLDGATQAEVSTLAAWYWLCLHIKAEDAPLTPNELVPYATKLANAGMLRFDQTAEMIERVGYLEKLENFADAVSKLDTVKTDRVTVVTLYSALSNGWYGSPDSRQVVAISLEYPPLFISMLYTAVNERGYRRVPIAEIAKNFNKRGNHEAFTASVKSAIRAYGV